VLEDDGKIKSDLINQIGHEIKDKLNTVKGLETGIEDHEVLKSLHSKIIEFTSRSVP
jgi:hypothetical protein